MCAGTLSYLVRKHFDLCFLRGQFLAALPHNSVPNSPKAGHLLTIHGRTLTRCWDSRTHITHTYTRTHKRTYAYTHTYADAHARRGGDMKDKESMIERDVYVEKTQMITILNVNG